MNQALARRKAKHPQGAETSCVNPARNNLIQRKKTVDLFAVEEQQGDEGTWLNENYNTNLRHKHSEGGL